MFLVCIKFIIREVLHFKKGAVFTLLRCLLEKGVQIHKRNFSNRQPMKFNMDYVCDSHVERRTEVCWTTLNFTDDFKFILKV